MLNERALRYFVAVAETLHVGQAAEKLGIAQPALSQHIRLLENKLSVRLFHRAHRRIELTEAGRVLLEEAHQLLAASQGAIDRVRQVEQGDAGDLQIGYSGSVVFEPLFQQLIQTYRDRYPGVRLCMGEDTIDGQLAALARGEIDIAMARGPVPALPNGLRARPFVTTPLVAALPRDHRLLARRTVPTSALAAEPLIGYRDPPGYGLAQDVQRLLARADVRPQVVMLAGSLLSVLGLVSTGLGIGIIPYPSSQFTVAAVQTRPLEDREATSVVLLLTRRTRLSGPADHFLCLAMSLAQGGERG